MHVCMRKRSTFLCDNHKNMTEGYLTYIWVCVRACVNASFETNLYIMLWHKCHGTSIEARRSCRNACMVLYILCKYLIWTSCCNFLCNLSRTHFIYAHIFHSSQMLTLLSSFFSLLLLLLFSFFLPLVVRSCPNHFFLLLPLHFAQHQLPLGNLNHQVNGAKMPLEERKFIRI